MANLIIAPSRRVRSDLRNSDNPLPAGNVQQHHENDAPQHFPDQKSHDVVMILKDVNKNLSGELGECWMYYVDEYHQVTIDYGISQQQKLQLLQKILSKFEAILVGACG